LKGALNDIGVSGITVTQVLGCGTQKGYPEYYRGVAVEFPSAKNPGRCGGKQGSCKSCD
jgi:nitrogen regulatory protein PII